MKKQTLEFCGIYEKKRQYRLEITSFMNEVTENGLTESLLGF